MAWDIVTAMADVWLTLPHQHAISRWAIIAFGTYPPLLLVPDRRRRR
jgi:hypothetical protein